MSLEKKHKINIIYKIYSFLIVLWKNNDEKYLGPRI